MTDRFCHSASIWVITSCLTILAAASSVKADEPNRITSWQPLTASEMTTQVARALADLPLDELVQQQLGHLLHDHDDRWLREPNTMLFEVLSVAVPETRPQLTALQWTNSAVDDFEHELIDIPTGHEWVDTQLRWLTARWLVQHERYDEALPLLTGLETEDVLDPPGLLFAQAVTFQQLHDYEKATLSLQRLLKHPQSIPRRYGALAELMLADMQQMQMGTLDEVARLMDDLYRRQRLRLADASIAARHQTVLDKLDEMIEQAQQQHDSQNTAAAAPTPSNAPNEDGQTGEGSSSVAGNATPRHLATTEAWGDVPPEKRAAQLAELVKDMPPQYRDLVEEYFLKLAQQEPRQQ